MSVGPSRVIPRARTRATSLPFELFAVGLCGTECPFRYGLSPTVAGVFKYGR